MKTMKNLFGILTVGFMLLGISSCSIIGGVLTGLEEINDEAEEIASGKVFTVAKGSVTYNDGTVLTFKEYGKVWKSETETEIFIVNDGICYTIDVETGTGYSIDYTEGFTGCPYIFWEKLYKFGDALGAEIKESKATIAGKKCTVFKADDGTEVAGWERILFKDGDTLEAVSWSDNVPNDAFSVDGYEIEEY